MTTHGLSGLPELMVWHAMVARCHKPGASGYDGYGAKGISVCARWRESPLNFLADMGRRPSDRYSIDRRENAGNYSCGKCSECLEKEWPSNCRWATDEEQIRNSSHARMFTIDGKTQCMLDWAREFNIEYDCLIGRLRRGASIEDALSLPQGGGISIARRKRILEIGEHGVRRETLRAYVAKKESVSLHRACKIIKRSCEETLSLAVEAGLEIDRSEGDSARKINLVF